MKKIILVIVLIGIAYFIGNQFNKEVVYKQIEKEVILDNLTGKVNQLKGELVAEIKTCESAGYSEDFGLVTFDPNPNNKKVEIASFGSYQFKKSTVKFYYKKFYNKELTGKEAILIALDDQKAGELATEVIFRDGALGNWYNCTKKLNSQAKLDVIRKLEQ